MTRDFSIVLSLTFLGFAFEQTLRPVIPLVVVDRGGSAMLVGLVAAVHALPALLFRPAIGQLIDGGRLVGLLRTGSVSAMLSPLGVLLPGIVSLTVVRFVQGTSWAMYAVSTRTLMARHAPANRRGETSGYFALMPAVATLVGPGIGVALYLSFGEVGPVLLAMALGGAAAAIALIARLRTGVSGRRLRQPRPSSLQFFERSSIPPTVMITTFLSGQTLFTIFPPLYVLSIGASLDVLALYYPVYGIVMVASQLVAGRISDHVGRAGATRIGCSVAIVGLSIAAIAGEVWVFTMGAVIFAVAVSIVVPTMSAIAIDRAPAASLGAAMATYSIGYQLATGASSLTWGALISTSGFQWAVIVAIGLQLITIALSIHYTGR